MPASSLDKPTFRVGKAGDKITVVTLIGGVPHALLALKREPFVLGYIRSLEDSFEVKGARGPAYLFPTTKRADKRTKLVPHPNPRFSGVYVPTKHFSELQEYFRE
jgi:hypothetical protein